MPSLCEETTKSATFVVAPRANNDSRKEATREDLASEGPREERRTLAELETFLLLLVLEEEHDLVEEGPGTMAWQASWGQSESVTAFPLLPFLGPCLEGETEGRRKLVGSSTRTSKHLFSRPWDRGLGKRTWVDDD